MKNILTLLFVGLMLPLHSQPTLTSANEATIGNSFLYIFADTAGVTPGGSGAMQTWDYSGVTSAGGTQTDQWADPASTPYASSFPGSNIVQLVDNGGGIIYLYHTLSTSSTELNGIVTDISGMPNIMNYYNSQVLRQFPAMLNTTISDTYSGISTLIIGPITATTYREGTYEYLVDAYGTLITPNGNYPNTLRIKLEQVFTDSSVFTGNPLPPIVTQSFSTTYFWASTDAGDRLYQFYIGYDSTVSTAGPSTFMSVSYQDDATGISENSVQLRTDIASFPNPATENVTIRIENPVNGEATLELFNSMGSRVQALEARMTMSGHLDWQFSVSELPPGLYTARVHCSDRYWISKILKQ